MSLSRQTFKARLSWILVLATLGLTAVLPASAVSPFPATSAHAQAPTEPALISASGGVTGSFVVQGSTGFLVEGASLSILDLQDPVHPRLRTSLPWVTAINDITTAGNLVYMVDGARQLQIVDMSAPDQPVLRGSVSLPSYGQVVAVNNNIAAIPIAVEHGNFITEYALQLVDVSDPDRPSLRGKTSLWFSPRAIQIVGTLAFVAASGGESTAYPGGLQIVDFSKPDYPVHRGSYTFTAPYGASGMHIVGSLAYMTDYQQLKIIDVRDPAHPTLRGSYTTGDNAYGVWAAAGYATVETHSGLHIVDIRNPGQPVLQKAITIANLAYFEGQIRIIGTTALATTEHGLQSIDIHDPTAPTLQGSYRGIGRMTEIRVVGTHAYQEETLSQRLEILDIANPEHPSVIGSINVPEGVADFEIAGNTAVIANRPSRTAITPYSALFLVDVSNPAAPAFISSYTLAGPAVDVEVVEDLAYVVIDGGFYGNFSGLQIIDISDPKTPSQLGYYRAQWPREVQITAGRAYLPSLTSPEQATIDVLDVSNPHVPVTLGTLPLKRGYRIVDQLLFSSDGSFEIIDVSDVAHPIVRGRLDGVSGCAINITGSFAYVNGCDGQLHIVDVSDIENPSLRAALMPVALLMNGLITDIQVVGPLIYCAMDFAGLRILYADPSQFTSQTVTRLAASLQSEPDVMSIQSTAGSVLPDAQITVSTQNPDGQTIPSNDFVYLIDTQQRAKLPTKIAFVPEDQGRRTTSLHLPMNTQTNIAVINGRTGVGTVITVNSSSYKRYAPIAARL